MAKKVAKKAAPKRPVKKKAARVKAAKKKGGPSPDQKALPGMDDARILGLDVAIDEWRKAHVSIASAKTRKDKHTDKIARLMRENGVKKYSQGSDQFILEPGQDKLVHKAVKSKEK